MTDRLERLLQRLTREELDGIAPNDTRYDPDFFVDVIFHDDDNGDDDDGSTPSGTAAVQSPSSSSIWQHVDQRTAHMAAGERRSAASSEQPESESARGSNPAPNTNSIAESANFTIDFEDSSGTASTEGDHISSRNANSSGDDPAAQWLGKVQEFEDLEMFSLQPAADNVNTVAQPQVPAAGDDDTAHGKDGPPPKPSTLAVIATMNAESEAQETAEPRTTAVQQESSRAAPTAVSAAVAAAVAAASDAQTKKAARTAAMAPASDSIEISDVETTAAGVEASAAGTNGTPLAAPVRTTSENSFDEWLEDDVGASPPPIDGLVETVAPAARTGPAAVAGAAAPAAVPDGKSASDDLDDFMASLDDL
jgi:hypothetical protein